ncbi:MAG: DUF1015 family protein [Planctomycetota bacterium]|jgi:uncharacterized protein (DUF1015 family)
MPETKAFQGIRYDFERCGGDISTLIAPPYDVLNQADKDRLQARSPHNIVGIDLPHIPPKSAGPDSVYQAAAHTLEKWRGEQALIQEDRPALYLYHQVFEHAGQQYTRRKFVARVRLTPFSAGEVLPHEKTFGGPKEDRLALMKATRCQLSPIFGLYADPDDRIGQAFAATAGSEPSATGVLDGVESRTWIVKDEAVIAQVEQEMADHKIYIADGHHRYGTALLYRDWYAAEFDDYHDDHPVNYVMFVLASMDDPGCLILPYCRAVSGVGLDSLLEAWSAGVEICDRNVSDARLRDGSTGKEVCVRYSARDRLRELEPDQVEPWYALDYAYLHRYLIDDLLKHSTHGDVAIRYVKSEEDAMAAAAGDGGTALLIKSTPMEHLKAMSEAGGLMPQKSTYFFPKLATGIVLNELRSAD